MSPLAARGRGSAFLQGEALTGTLESWTPDTRDDALAAEKWWGEQFVAANPGVTLKQLSVPYGEDTTKLTAGNAAGVVPDMLYAYSQLMYTYGVDGITQPVNDLIDPIGRDRFIPAALEGITVDGNIYTVPQTGFPFFIYYRKDLYDELGLPIPDTHEQLLENVAAVHNPPDIYGFIVTNQRSATLEPQVGDVDPRRVLLRRERPARPGPTGDAGSVAVLQGSRHVLASGQHGPERPQVAGALRRRQGRPYAHTTSMSANFTPEDLPRFGGFLYPQKEGAKGASLDFQGNNITDEGEVARPRPRGDRVPARPRELPGVPAADGRRLGADAPGRLHGRVSQQRADSSTPAPIILPATVQPHASLPCAAAVRAWSERSTSSSSAEGGRLARLRREPQRPAAFAQDILASRAWVERGDCKLARLRIRLHQAEVGDDLGRAFGRHPKRCAALRPAPWPSEVTKGSFSTKARRPIAMVMKISWQLVAISGAPPPPGSRTFGFA